MASVVRRVSELGLAKPPSFIPTNLHYEGIIGSYAYGVSSDTSDMDIYGFTIPHKDVVFPHLGGEILGFGRQKKRFEQWQQHHIEDKEAGKQYDIQIYGIVKYFHLCSECNPNMLDSLFVPQRCVLYITKIGQMVRNNRKLFLSKKVLHTYLGYSYAQMHKIEIKRPEGLDAVESFERSHGIDRPYSSEEVDEYLKESYLVERPLDHESLSRLTQEDLYSYSKILKDCSKRALDVREHSFDTKFAYHVVRLLGEAEQILTEGDLDLERNNEQLKAIRRGEVPLEDIKQMFSDRERSLREHYEKSSLRNEPDEKGLKALLFSCLEEHFGRLDNCVVMEGRTQSLVSDIESVLDRYR